MSGQEPVRRERQVQRGAPDAMDSEEPSRAGTENGSLSRPGGMDSRQKHPAEDPLTQSRWVFSSGRLVVG